MDFSEQTVMVVEDHDFQRRTVMRLLQGLGFGDLLEATNGHQALSLLRARAEPLDILLCDLDMPEMDGVEFISHLAEKELVKALLVVSGLEPSILHTVETMAKAYGLQVLGTISKPLTLQELSACLDRYQPKEEESKVHSFLEEASPEILRQGLAQKEFLAFFQPKVSFATGELLGVEALVRWFRPGIGVVLPKHFIPAMELAGLVEPLTDALLWQTCAYLRAWSERGLTLSASVNVSTNCLSDVRIADRWNDLVRREDCDPSQIVLEVTETEVMSEVAKVLNVLARLRLKGFGLSIDDFGTGYSSLQQLSNVPFTELKIDQSFVKDSPKQPRHRTIIEMSLELARKLNLKTVAEGVETQAEWDLLKALGCEQAQGYFMAKPMPGHQIPDWRQMWQPPEG